MKNWDIKKILKSWWSLEDYSDIAKEYNCHPERIRQLVKENVKEWEFKTRKKLMADKRRDKRDEKTRQNKITKKLTKII